MVTSFIFHFFETLSIVLIIFKLCGMTNLPWLWVLSPLWGAALLCLALYVIIFIWCYIKEKSEV